MPDRRCPIYPFPCPFPTKSSTCRASRPTRWRRARARRAWPTSPRRSSPAPAIAGLVDVAARDARGGGLQARRRGDPRRARRRRRGLWGLGAHVIKTGLSPVLIDLMERGFVSALATERRRRSSTTSRSRWPARPRRTSTRRSARAASAWPKKPAGMLNAAINAGVAAGKGIGQAVGDQLLDDAAAARPASAWWLRRAARRAGHRARGDRHRHHPHASRRVGRGARRGQPARLPLLRLQRRAAARRRLPELRLGRGPAGGVPEGRGAGPQPRHRRSTG